MPASGLTTAEAVRRRAIHGPNQLPPSRPVPWWRRVLQQLRSPLIYILVFAFAFDLAEWAHAGAGGAPFEAIVIGVVLAFNAGLGTFQELRSEHALARLQALTAPQAWVLRDGAQVRVPAAELVPGDVMRIEAGDRLPADGVLVDAHGVSIDESVVTGESVPVDKAADAEVLAGTLAVRGRALVEVTRTGAASNLGRLASTLSSIERGRTPLERRLDAFGHRVARWVIAIGATMVLLGLVVEGPGQVDEIVLFAVALAVAAVPEGLPAVATLTLALGVQRMARRQAIVRRLAAVEGLGAVTVIATDKTGTLTENQMSVRALDSDQPAEALTAIVLANDAELAASAGDPLELGLLRFASGRGVDVAAVRRAWPRVGERPFDSAWKYMRVTVRSAAGDEVSYLKGAVEVLLARCRMAADERARWMLRADQHAREGLRVLGVARGGAAPEDELDFLGLVMLWDPPRPEVREAMRAAQAAGVRVLMITGDHPATAAAVARDVGIAGVDAGVLTGDELARLPAEALADAVARINVYARVAPEHKLAIVTALAARGEIVAVTGDGVNDAPALKRADVGVAMGRRGSDVAREVADVVLLDDNFATVVAAIEEGRSIHVNIQKFVRLMFSTNVALVLLVLVAAVAAFAFELREPSGMLLLPLTAIQLLWINLVADGPSALALGVDRNADVMRQPPRPPGDDILDPASVRFVIVTGVAKAAVGAAILVAFPALGYALVETRSAVFLYESLAQLVFAYPARRLVGRQQRNGWLDASIAIGVALQLAAILVAPLRALLGLTPLDAVALACVAGGVALTWLVGEAVSHHGRRGQRAPRRAGVPALSAA